MGRPHVPFLIVVAAATLAAGCTPSGSDGDTTDDTHDSEWTDPGALPDGDADGVPDQWEVDGYVAKNGEVQPWDGDASVPHFFTDPDEYSTDRDPYPDGMEATGKGMDPTVAPPGNHPLVPALPQIVAVLDEYSIIPLSEITLTDGTSRSSGTEIEESVTQTSSRTAETSWEAGGSVTVSGSIGTTWAGTPTGSVSVEVSAYYTQTQSNTASDGTSSGRRNTTSKEETTSWSRATTTTPSKAARIKLAARLLNRGSATATDVKPTFGLRIGDVDVATFNPPTDVVSLRPGATYPASGHWILDTDAFGNVLTLTLDELKMIQTGMPVSLVVQQVDSTVVVPDGIDWSESGTWAAYLAGVLPLSARITADDGGGGVVEGLVYAKSGDDLPDTTLADALSVGLGLRPSPSGDGSTVVSMTNSDGDTYDAIVDGWRLALDPDTWGAVHAQLGDGALNPMDLTLAPGMSVRLVPGPKAGDTLIHFAQWVDDGGGSRSLEVAAADLSFAGAALDVEAAIPGVGTKALSLDTSTGLVRASGIHLPEGELAGGATHITAINPIDADAGNPPATFDIGTSVPLVSRLGGKLQAIIERQVDGKGWTDWSWNNRYYSSALDMETLTGGERPDPSTTVAWKPSTPNQHPFGVRLVVDTQYEQWFLQVENYATNGGWCLLPAGIRGEDVRSSDLSGCTWHPIFYLFQGTIPQPVDVDVAQGVLAVRFDSRTPSTYPSSNDADRLLILDFKSPPSGDSFLHASDVEVSYDASLYRY